MKKIYCIFLLFLAFTGCEKEEIILHSNIQQDDLQSIQKQFSLSDFEDKYIKENLKVNWNNFRKIDQKETVFEFTTSLKSQLQNDQNPLYYKYNLLAYKNNDAWRFELVKFMTFDAGLLTSATSDKTEDFTGTMYKYDMTGAAIQIRAFDKGKSFSLIKKENLDPPANAKYMPPRWEDPSDPRWIMITTEFFTDYWDVGYNNFGQLTVDYLGSYRHHVRREYMYVPPNRPAPGLGDYDGHNTYHQHGSGPHGPTINQNPHPYENELDEEPEEEEEETVKIINELEGKAECIYEKLNQNSTSFVEAIKEFDGEFPVSHLKFSMDYGLPNTTNAVTDDDHQYLIEIKINGNTLADRTVLGLARTLAHETIHAELFRKVRSVNSAISIHDFPGIFDYYRRYFKGWQHQQMAAHYRQTIVDILKEFDNRNHTDQFYNDLAWEGLHNTVAWNELSSTERTRITNVIVNYKDTGNKNCD